MGGFLTNNDKVYMGILSVDRTPEGRARCLFSVHQLKDQTLTLG